MQSSGFLAVAKAYFLELCIITSTCVRLNLPALFIVDALAGPVCAAA